jgi:homogentisate phytyltransferase/homogentisate geranylgeranyltransferase
LDVLCRAVLVQLGFYFHMKGAMGAPGLTLTRPLLFAMSFMFAFSIVIALFKDIPDVKGDAQVGSKLSFQIHPPIPVCS